MKNEFGCVANPDLMAMIAAQSYCARLLDADESSHRLTNSEMIAAAALRKVDAVGVSILSGAHNTLCPRIVQLLREQGMDDCLVLLGGIVPQEDIAKLKSEGVAEVFLPGTSTEDIVSFLRANVKARE